MTEEFKKFRFQRYSANRRGIPFDLTFDQWWAIWQASGHWNERGCKKGQYCMSRVGDQGPYAVGNVFIQLHADNVKDVGHDITRTQTSEAMVKRIRSLTGRKLSPEHKEKIRQGMLKKKGSLSPLSSESK
jgi:hypothetical protein